MSRNAVQVLSRFWVVAFILSLPIGIPAILVGAISLPFLAFIALIAAVFFNGLQWLGHRVLFGGTKEYEELRANGLDAWFDVTCPWPFRSESEELPLTDEPEIRWFCRNCGAETFDPEMPCPACGYEQYECPICGSPVKDEFAACPRCGNDPLGRQGTC
ncbi:hypothetical protein AB1L30_17825 [Bremerella sp. JC817]|uniref:hypothetical protein n=1 Tax=Bremerella sp. JC817 TaxID=3231756 RepID=UPI00345B4164